MSTQIPNSQPEGVVQTDEAGSSNANTGIAKGSDTRTFTPPTQRENQPIEKPREPAERWRVDPAAKPSDSSAGSCDCDAGASDKSGASAGNVPI